MIKIFITNLGKYNEGELVGEWVELPVSENELDNVYDRIKICHGNVDYSDECGNPYEEIFITDYETDIEDFKVGEYDNIDDLNELADTLENMDEYEREVVEAMISEGCDLEEALEKKDDCMVYSNCNDMEDVAREYAEETGLLDSIPENLRNYFDFEAFGRDMSYEGQFIFTSNGNCVQIL